MRTPKMIQFGKFDISTWYSSPYPQVNKFDPILPTIHIVNFSGVCQASEAVSLRVLSEVHEVSSHPREASEEVSLAPPARGGGLQEGWHVSVRGGWQHQQDLLPEPLSARQAVPRSQDALLRRRAFPVLCPHPERQRGLSPGGVLQQGQHQSLFKPFF